MLTRSRTGQQNEDTKTGRLVNTYGKSAFEITLKYDGASLPCMGRIEDGADESITSAKLAKSAVRNGIYKIKLLKVLTVEVAPRDTKTAPKFTFSMEWAVLCLTRHLSVGPGALLNVSFLVADAELAENNLFIGQLVLMHLGSD